MTLSLLSPSTVEIAQASQKHWITPEQQLRQLVGREWDCIAEKLLDILPSSLCQDTAMIIAGYAFESRLISWYTALQEIGQLPKKVPELSEADIAFLNSPCPKQICGKRKPDGSFYSIIEKCALLLIPEELENLERLTSVVTSYGEKHYPKDKNPLKIVCHNCDDSQESWKTRFGSTHWELHSDLLEGSQDIDYACHRGFIKSLAKETSKDWEVPELRGRIAAIFFLHIGSGETLQDSIPGSADFGIINDSNKHLLGCTGAWVKDTCFTANHLFVMNTSKGVVVSTSECSADFLGMGACLKL